MTLITLFWSQKSALICARALSHAHTTQTALTKASFIWSRVQLAAAGYRGPKQQQRPKWLCVPRGRCCFGTRGPQRPIGLCSRWSLKLWVAGSLGFILVLSTVLGQLRGNQDNDSNYKSAALQKFLFVRRNISFWKTWVSTSTNNDKSNENYRKTQSACREFTVQFT